MAGFATTLRLGLALARRELRGGLKGLRIVLACLALGVFTIAAVGTITAAVKAGLATNGRAILGGDLELQVIHRPMPPEAAAWLAPRAQVSSVVEMRAIAAALDDAGRSGERMLVELKAVDRAYPLYGEVVLDTGAASGAAPLPLAEALAERDGAFGLVAERLVLDRLGVKPGDRLRIGEARFVLRGVIEKEPDRIASAAILGPRVMIAAAALPATELIQPGSLVRYEYRLRLPEGSDAGAFAESLSAAFPQAGWRIRDFTRAAPGVNRFIDRTALFLTLVGLTALLVGGIGVANGVRAWLEQRARTIATLKCLGASGRVVFVTYFIQLAVIGAIGILAGLALGVAMPWIGVRLLADILPVPAIVGIYPAPLALAAAFGALSALAFALWPLARAREIAPGSLFRDLVQRSRRWPRPGLVALNAAVVAALVALTIATSTDRRFALWFCVAAAGTLLALRLGAEGLMALARRLPHARRPFLRLGLANLYRPGAATPSVLVSLGLGLTTLAAVAVIQGNISRQVLEQMPAQAPAFFLIDLQSDQVERFDALVQETNGIGRVQRVPSLRGQIVAINGVPAEEARVSSDTAWALRGDRGLTYAATPPDGTRLIEGNWWPADYRGPPLVSFDAALARGFGLRIGDRMTVNVLGRDIELELANTRDIDWRSLGMNFTLVVSPGLLEAAPHSYIATVYADAAAEPGIFRAVTDAFSNVTAIRVRDALEAVNALMGQIAIALRSTAGITLLSGALVLAGAIAAGQRRRIYDAVVLKTLGATRRQVLAAYAVEYGLLGLVAGIIAAAMGSAAAWWVITVITRAEWVFLPVTLAATVVGCVLATIAFGFLGTWRSLSAKAGPLLRNE
ncbi:MAG: FtsX-like permease family protein [Alphaproteobacteria bacterium]|nr:FtsX-like permease family protein [Alphaproteobacteria bacterium]